MQFIEICDPRIAVKMKPIADILIKDNLQCIPIDLIPSNMRDFLPAVYENTWNPIFKYPDKLKYEEECQTVVQDI